MRLKTKQYAKLAATSLIAAFSFGLAISCVSNHEQNINKVFAEDDISTTWSYNPDNKALTCTYASNYPNGFIMETNQVSVTGLGGGQYQLVYNVLGYPRNAVEAEYTDYGNFTLTFSGSYSSTPSGDGSYGSITACPLDVSGLDSETEYEIYLKVEPTVEMNQQGSGSIYYDRGEFYSQEGGSDALVLSTIKFYGDITYENGSADLIFNSTGGANVGTLRMSSISFYPKPDGDGTSYNGTIAGAIASTGAQVEDYFCNSGTIFQHEEVFDPNSVTWDWDGNNSVYSYDYTSASTGTTTTYKAAFLPPSGASGEDQIICEYTQGSGVANVRTTIYNDNNGDPIETGMTKSFEFLLASEPSSDGDRYIFQFGTTVLYTFGIDAIYVSIVEGQAPEPPDLSDLQWYFNEDMGYFSTNLYQDNYYSFSLNTNIVSVIYNRANAALTANCTVQAAEGNIPDEYYNAEISFVYTNAFGSVVEQVWYFNDAQCEATIEDKENLHFSVDKVSFTKLGWYYEEDLRYYKEEDVEASWNIDHCEYRKEGNRDEFILYMDVVYNDNHIFPNFDVIQINTPDFDDSPYPGQTIIGSGVNGWCDKLQQYITIPCNSVPFAYYGDGWSYDAYHATLVYISSENIELEYELTSVDIDGEYYNLTYTAADGDSQTFVVSNASYIDEVLTGRVTLYNGGDSIDVSLNIPESIVNPGSAYDYGWTYEADNQKLVYYDPEYGVYTLVRGVNNVMDKVVTLTYESTEGDNPSQTMTIDIDFSDGTGGCDYSANTVSGYARLQGESSTAEYITVLLENKNGNIINLNGANTWGYDGDGIIWINASSNSVPIDDLRDNMTGSTFYLADGTSNQYCEIDYTYDGRELPTLTINKATYEEHELDDNEGVEYIVSGIFERLDESSVSVTIPGEFWHPRSLIPDYVVSFDANGGEGEMNPESLTPQSDGGSISYLLPDCSFTREGFSFAGWATSNSGENLTPAGENYNLTESTTFYAMWTENPQVVTYTVSFDGNGATAGYVEDIIVEPVDGTYSVELPDNNYSRDGYSFYGWSLFEEGGLPFNPGTVRSIDGDTTFYAYWIQSSFTITFNANGGTGEMAARTYEKGNQEVPGCDFVKEGYTFVGWAVDSVDSETIVNAGDIVNVTKDYTLYALWEENPPVIEDYSYEIVYDANNGSGKTSLDTFIDSNSSLEYELLSASDVGFSYEGFTFVGWSLSIDGDILSGTVTVEAGTTKLYAIWEEESIPPEPPEYKQYWTYDDLELRYVDEAHPDYLTRVDKAIYSERSLTASVLVSILNEQEEVVDTKYISLSNASYEILEEGYGSVTGYFNLLTNEDKVITLQYLEIAVEKIPVTPEEKAADVSEEQIAQINSLLPETQDSRVEEVIGDLNQGTAYQIVEVATDAKSFIDELREEGGEGYTEEDYQRDLQTVQSATEAAVVVGAASKDSNITAQVQEMTKSTPQDTGVDLNGVLKDFYEQQMKYLLGEDVASKEGEQPSRGIKRAEEPKVNKVSVDDYLKQEFDQMLDFVDRSVDDIEGTLLQVRKCSHESVKLAVNQSITTITSKSFRDFDKAKADREFVETLEPVMMATMQSQVLAVLEEEYNNSDHRNKDKDQAILDEIEAVKDIEMFRIMVMEVLRQKYESLDGSKSYEDDLEKFTEEIYWPCFEAWALDKESPVGFTFEELTKATIESSSKRANSYVIATSADKPEIVFISVFAGVTAVAIAGAIAVPTILKKKRRGLAE